MSAARRFRGDYSLKEKYEICVIGAGLVGSSAAKHASARKDVSVCLIGPKEPECYTDQDVFGAWYDEGRVCRITDSDPFWAYVAQKSAARYTDIENQSGIKFFTEAGILNVLATSTLENSPIVQTAVKQNVPIEKLAPSELKVRFPFLNFEEDSPALFTKPGSGYCSPRRLNAAQQTIAHLQGCDIVDDIVEGVNESADGTYNVLLNGGQIVNARKVLVAAGAFAKFKNLLPIGVEPDYSIIKQTVVFVEIEDETTKDKLKNCPSILCPELTHANAIQTAKLHGRQPSPEEKQKYSNYILPPIKYPNGKTYIKMGHGSYFEEELTNLAEIKNWFLSGGSDELLKVLSAEIVNIFPDLASRPVTKAACLTTRTSTHRPFIDLIKPGYVVAIAMNGYGAKSCDELGRIAVKLILDNEWDCPFSRSEFQLRNKHTSRL